MDELRVNADRLNEALSGRYRLERELGSGGMATVWLANDERHGRQVAVKLLRPALGAAIGPERFLREIRVLANLHHPNILPLHESGEAAGHLFFVMPYVAGESLRARLRREKQLPVDEAVGLAIEIASALGHAHRQGVIHRDIKPENILLQDGHALVADFGIALVVQRADGSRLTQAGLNVGTPQYMSPEQVAGEEEPGPQSDIYSLGCLLYEMLTGNPPHRGPTLTALLAQILSGTIRPVRDARETVPPHVEAALQKALSRLPADRFRTADAFASALARPLEPHLDASVGRGGVRRRAAAFAGYALAAVLLALALSERMQRRAAESVTLSVYDVGLPEEARISFRPAGLSSLTISPDGGFVIYTAARGQSTELWYRSVHNADAHAMPGTEGGTSPMLSPDGSQLAFLTDHQLKLVPVEGGAVSVLADVIAPSGARWVSATRLLVADADGWELRWIEADGRQAGVTRARHCVLPEILVPEERLLCAGVNEIPRVVALAGGAETMLGDTTPAGATTTALRGSSFSLVQQKYLTYLGAAGDLRAAFIDPRSLSVGRSVSLVPDVRRESYTGAGQYAISASGTLVYAPGAGADIGSLVANGDAGAEPLAIEPAAFLRFAISPGRRWLAAIVQSVHDQELRLYDLITGERSVWVRGANLGSPVWTKSPERLLFVLQQTADEVPALVVGVPQRAGLDTIAREAFSPAGFFPDGSMLGWANTRLQAVRYRPAEPTRLDTLAEGAYFPAISPDGRWLAYQVSATGELVVESMAGRGRYRVAVGGWEPHWASPSELRYWMGTTWYRATLRDNGNDITIESQRWFSDPRFADTLGRSWDLLPDGRALYMQGPEHITAAWLRVIPNWVESMKRAADAARSAR